MTSTWIPSERFYVSYGVFDGNKARGVVTGLTGPEFNGYYFHIAETGTNWTLGSEQKPGFFSVGGWRQTGELSTDDGLIEEDGAEGVYFVGSQLLWYRAALQLLFRSGLYRTRPRPAPAKDTFGIGMALGWLNPNTFQQDTELVLQSYYQAHVTGAIYTETALSYPGARVAEHEHVGHEHMLVIEGDEYDEHGTYPAGSFVINPPGTRHSPSSVGGCVALLIYEKAVRFVEPE